MVEDCVFCKIVRKESFAYLVYEDEKVLAFLDNRPVSEGHTLVIPRAHYENLYTVPDDEVAYLFGIVKKVVLAVKAAVKADGIRIVQSNGSAAGQVVFHTHVHIISSYKNQKKCNRRIYMDEEFEKIQIKIKSYING